MTARGLLTPSGFDRLLSELNPDRDAAGLLYEQLRRRLVRFFEGRSSRFPDEQADETLNRVARKLDAGEAIRDVTTYVIGVARMVLLEAAKNASKDAAAREFAQSSAGSHSDPGANDDRTLDCLHSCLDRLPHQDRQLILRYYQDDRQAKIRHRHRLAAEMGIELNALRIRAYRIRARLESCERPASTSRRFNG